MTASKTTNYFSDATSITTTKEYEYNNPQNIQATAYIEYNSDGIYRTEVEYAHEVNAPDNRMNFNGLLVANRIADPIRTKRYKEGEFILGTYINYIGSFGSMTSSNPKFMIQLYPNVIEVPVISNIQYDGYGFPSSVQRYTDEFYHLQIFEWDKGSLLSTTTGLHRKTIIY